MATATAAADLPPPRAPALAVPAHLLDIGLWLVACAPLAASPLVDGRSRGVTDVVGALLALALIMFRRRWPVPTLAVGLGAAVVLTAVAAQPNPMLPAVLVLLFNVAVRSDRPTTIRAGVAGLAGFLASICVLVSRDAFGPELLAALAWPTLAVAAGDAVRSRREAISAAKDRAARAEATREAHAQRRVVEERLHIARELHDVIAHQIAVISVQAGAAAHLMETRPDDARASLATVRGSAQQVLDELAAILSILRTSDDQLLATDPTPTLADLPSLVASFEPAGLRVDLETVGEHHPVPGTTAVAVFRTVQEALTNAHKHGDGGACLRIAHRPGEVEVVVSNRRRVPTIDHPVVGYGLVGMRERIDAAGGELVVGPGCRDTFVLRARFPTPPSADLS